MVLDGANRVMALQMLQYPHVLAQVVPYQQPQVTLTTWHHVIECMDPKSLTAELTNLEGVDLVLTDRMRARAGLARREYLMYVIRADGEVFAARLNSPASGMTEQNRILNALVDTYKDRSAAPGDDRRAG